MNVTPSERTRSAHESESFPPLEPPTNEELARNLNLLLNALNAMRNGDFSVRLPTEWTGIYGRLADVFNDVVMSNEGMAQELERVSSMVGKGGNLQERARFHGRVGAWRGMENSVNKIGRAHV